MCVSIWRLGSLLRLLHAKRVLSSAHNHVWGPCSAGEEAPGREGVRAACGGCRCGRCWLARRPFHKSASSILGGRFVRPMMQRSWRSRRCLAAFCQYMSTRLLQTRWVLLALAWVLLSQAMQGTGCCSVGTCYQDLLSLVQTDTQCSLARFRIN